MGKKVRGAALRAKKRSREAVEEIQERQAEQVAQQSVADKSNDELFVLDTTGNKNHANPTKKKQKSKHVKDDQVAIDKFMKRHNNDAAKLAKIADQGKKMMTSTRHRKALKGQTKANFDLWGSDKPNEKTAAKRPSVAVGVAPAGIMTSHVKTKARKVSDAAEDKKMVAVDVAKPGQSYHPDPKSHQAVLAEAVHMELAREKAMKDRDTPINANGMLPETRALLLGSDDESSSDEESDGEIQAVGPLPKRTNKKTRAQRNKEQRLRQERAIMDKRKKNKKLMNEVSEIGRYKKEIKRHKKEKHELRQKIQETKDSQKPLGKDLHEKLAKEAPITAPTLPVALPSEIQKSGSLRTVKPKGSLASERLASLMDRNLAVKRTKNPNHCRDKRRKKSLKGKGNRDGIGDGFMVKG